MVSQAMCCSIMVSRRSKTICPVSRSSWQRKASSLSKVWIASARRVETASITPMRWFIGTVAYIASDREVPPHFGR